MDYLEKSNLTIAEFMELDYDPEKNGIHAYDLYYESSWDWIMPVIEKIDKTPVLSNKEEEYFYCVTLEGSVASILDAFTGTEVVKITLEETNWLELASQLIRKFITWYNESK